MTSENTRLKLDEIRADEYKQLQVTAYENDIARLHSRLDEFVAANCPACDRDDADFKYEKYRCQFRECRHCKTIYMSPRPSREVMDYYYSNSENYAIWNKYIFPKSEANRREKICRPNLEAIVAECKRSGMQKPRFLEVGAGFGTFAELANQIGYFGDVFVLEHTPDMVASCRAKGLNVIDAWLEEAGPEHRESFDVAACFEVIEHIFDPFDFLKVVSGLLRTGGLFAFTCPNGRGFDTMMLEGAAPAVDTEHVNLFNTDSIGIVLERAGFELVSVETPGQLDVELVRRAVQAGQSDLDKDPFWRLLLVDEFDRLAGPFQAFLAANRLSGNMRVIARKAG